MTDGLIDSVCTQKTTGLKTTGISPESLKRGARNLCRDVMSPPVCLTTYQKIVSQLPSDPDTALVKYSSPSKISDSYEGKLDRCVKRAALHQD